MRIWRNCSPVQPYPQTSLLIAYILCERVCKLPFTSRDNKAVCCWLVGRKTLPLDEKSSSLYSENLQVSPMKAWSWHYYTWDLQRRDCHQQSSSPALTSLPGHPEPSPRGLFQSRTLTCRAPLTTNSHFKFKNHKRTSYHVHRWSAENTNRDSDTERIGCWLWN